MTDPSSATKPPSPADQRVYSEVEDALELANYAVSTGVKDSNGQPLALANIETIQLTAALLGLIDVKAGAAGDAAGSVTIQQWNAFEQAYYRLASALSPVTAETLRDTKNVARPRHHGFFRNIIEKLRDRSPAQRFTVKLWGWTIGFAIVILVAELGTNLLGLSPKQNDPWIKGGHDFFQAILPWAYGGLGACAYMLRSAHYFIYQRTFDVRRTPEYFNRILLGAVSGGAIILFVEYLSSADDGSTAHIGSTALGFIAGYSGDFLFNSVERIVNAIFPKDAYGNDDSKSKSAKGGSPGGSSNNGPATDNNGSATDDGSQTQNGDKTTQNGDKTKTA